MKDTFKLQVVIPNELKSALAIYAQEHNEKPAQSLRTILCEKLVAEGFLSSVDIGKLSPGGDQFTPRLANCTQEKRTEIYETYRALAERARNSKQMHNDVVSRKTPNSLFCD